MGKSTVTEDEIERKSHALLSEYIANEKIEVNIQSVSSMKVM
jgi:translation initiation factor 4G